jgi:DNA (cytosine-5)-methyltransferase 1
MILKSVNARLVDTNMPLKRIDYLPFLEACWQEHLQEKPINAPTVISTFAGCGGSSLGYSMAGFRELLAIEWDNNAVETFKLNFPDVPVYHGDIAKISVEQVLSMTGLKPGELDIFDGSPPCQGFSTAGKRQLDDPRNQLFREYVRLLKGLQPKVFVMENVSGMVKGVMKIVFVEILKELKACGYKVSARLLNAMYFNVPQSRQRMIFIGVRNDLEIEPNHPEAESYSINIGNAISGCSSIPRLANSERITKYWNMMQPGQCIADVDPKGNGFTAIKIYPDKPSPTITKGWTAGTGLMHNLEPRFLSDAEIKRIGTFPDEYKTIGNSSDVIKRIGNSVPPLFMRSIARHIRTAILSNTGE